MTGGRDGELMLLLWDENERLGLAVTPLSAAPNGNDFYFGACHGINSRKRTGTCWQSHGINSKKRTGTCWQSVCGVTALIELMARDMCPLPASVTTHHSTKAAKALGNKVPDDH